MANRARASLRGSDRPSRAPVLPPKKSSAALIVVIVIVILIVLVAVGLIIFFLWRRSNTAVTPPPVVTPPTTGGCKTNADCTGGKLCNAITGACIECFDDGDCDGATPVCNPQTATCVAGCVSNANCSGDTPFCDVPSKTCVECLFLTDCTAAGEVCDVGTNTCVPGCFEDADCSGGTPVCNLDSNLCVTCLEDADCSGATPVCNLADKTCVECTNNADCSGNTPVCKTATKTCVACLTNADCPGGVCNTNTNVCAECFTDADCTAPETCDSNTLQCCVETTQAPITSFVVGQIVNAFSQPVPEEAYLQCFLNIPQDATKVKAAIRMYSQSGVFIGKSPDFTPLNNNVANNVNMFPMTNGALLHGKVIYKFALEIRSGCETWTEISPLTLEKSKDCSFAFQNYPAPTGDGASALNRSISLVYSSQIPDTAIAIALDRSPAHPNDYDYLFRDVPSVSDGYGDYAFAVTIPAGPTITSGVTTYTIWGFRENECFPLSTGNLNNSGYFFGGTFGI